MRFVYLLLVIVGFSGPLNASELSELTAICDGCHGADGVSAHSDVPIIAGQSAEYIDDTLHSYQIWGRPCVKTLYRSGDTTRPKTDMCKIAGGLSDEDIAALADHYSGQIFSSAPQEFDAANAETGAALHMQHCEKCHNEGGKSTTVGPRLAGQWVPYLKSTLKYVPTGEHQAPFMMEKALGNFSQEELDALMSFYASQQD